MFTYLPVVDNISVVCSEATVVSVISAISIQNIYDRNLYIYLFSQMSLSLYIHIYIPLENTGTLEVAETTGVSASKYDKSSTPEHLQI